MQGEAFIDAELGAGAFKRLWRELHGEPCAALLPNGQYQADPYVAVLEKAGKEMKQSCEEMTVEIARRNAREDLTSIYRVFLRIAAPQRVLEHIPRLWRMYFDFGTVTVTINDRGRFVGECHGIPAHLLDWASGGWRGFVPTAIELAGGKRVTGAVTRRGPGADLCFLRFEASYAV
jgi:hypothetical protein